MNAATLYKYTYFYSMKTKNSYQIYLWPMLISLILLTGFLGYWLTEEFKRERKSIALERQNEALHIYIKELKNGTETAQKIDQDTVIILETHTSFGDSTNVDVQVSTNIPNGAGSSIKIPNIDEAHTSTQVKITRTMTEPSGTKKTLDGIRPAKKDTHPMLLVFPDSATEQRDIEFIKVGSPWSDETAVEASAVFKNLIPQTLFSCLLLLSVSAAFYMIWKNMIRQRQLAELRNDLVSNMTHELKTPVSTIGVALEALSSFDAKNDPAKRKEYIDITRSEVSRLGLLIDKALNISLFENGKFTYDKQLINIQREAEWIKKTLQLQLESQQAQIETNYEGQDFTIYADQTHMVNVIHNLIENAIKYTSPPAKIQLNLEETPDTVIVTVADNGPGIAKEHLPRIFDKFFRVPQGNQHNVKGHGLGLSYVAEVIKQMGGQIDVSSTVGQGTTFRIEMPKVKSDSSVHSSSIKS